MSGKYSMPRIFISYRRSVSAGLAGRLRDRLVQEFGAENVFLDTHTIPPGETFSSFILKHISQADIFLPLIAEGTLDRVSDPDDWVRKEIAFALHQPSTAVIPVKIDDFKIPVADDLPHDMRDLVTMNFAMLRNDLFDETTKRIIDHIKALEQGGQSGNSLPVRMIAAVAMLLLIIAVFAAFIFLSGESEPDDPVSQANSTEATITTTATIRPSETTIIVSPSIDETPVTSTSTEADAIDSQVDNSANTQSSTSLVSIQRSADTIAICANSMQELATVSLDFGNNERYDLADYDLTASCFCMQQPDPLFPVPEVCNGVQLETMTTALGWRNITIEVIINSELIGICLADSQNRGVYECLFD